jgi:hypothetical protein
MKEICKEKKLRDEIAEIAEMLKLLKLLLYMCFRMKKKIQDVLLC